MNDTNTNNGSDGNNDSRKSGYFDLHVQGIGYVNRIRTVKVKKGYAFLACSISALRGDADDAEYTTFDVRVSGTDAQEIIKLLEADSNAKKAVVIGFKLGDIYAETFIYQKDTQYHKKGDVGVMIKGRLLKVTFAKVDGKTVDLSGYNQPKQAADGTNG